MKVQHFLRKCHVCGHVNQSDVDVDRCGHCRKALAPFFYFDAKKVLPLSDYQIRPVPFAGEYLPIRGLTVYWES